ncbi:MAG: hypothetical protein ACO1N0_08740 [Fluviicola sp.]
MKNLKLMLLFLATGNSVFAQEPDLGKLSAESKAGNTVYYSVIKDSPKGMKYAGISIPIWNLTGSFLNNSIYDLTTNGMFLNDKFQASVRYKIGLGDKLAPDTYEFMDYPNHDYIMSQYKANKNQYLALSASYFVKSKELTETITVRLKSSGKVTTVTKVPGTVIKKLGVTLGYEQGFTWYNMNNKEIVVEMRDEPGVQKTFNLNSQSTVQTFKYVKVGLNWTKTHFFKGKFEEFGDRSDSGIKTTWFNVIIAAQNKFDDVYAPVPSPENYYTTGSQNIRLSPATMDALNQKLPVGIEFGQRYSMFRSGISMDYNVRYLPGLMKTINFMLEVGASYNIGFIKNK